MTRRITKSKLREWLRRYLPAEIIATVTALVSATITYQVSQSYALAAVIGTIGENCGYYGYFIVLEFITQNKAHKQHGKIKRTLLTATKTFRNLIVEFGPAELLDSLLIRPFAMYLGPQLVSPYAIGLLVGKLSADAIFYSIAIVGYEAKEKWFKN